ncbi:MAG: ABC transporter substrate-binding protein [Candidatus Bathyarchaeia archaeon]
MRRSWIIAVLILAVLAINTGVQAPVRAQMYPLPATPFFKIYYLVPINIVARIAWSQMVVDQWRKLGIDVIPLLQDWDQITPEFLNSTPPANKESYVNGSFDLMSNYDDMGPEMDVKGYFTGEAMPIPGYANISNAIATTQDYQTRMALMRNYQDWYHYWEPYPAIFSNLMVQAQSRDISRPSINVLEYFINEEWPADISRSGPDQTVVYASTEKPVNLNAVLHDTAYDDVWTAGIYDTLSKYSSNMSVMPNLATDWQSENGPLGPGSRYIINLRHDVKWQDGWPFNATDVWFTWKAAMDPGIASTDSLYVSGCLGNITNVHITGQYQLTVDTLTPVSFPTRCMFQQEDQLPGAIVPWHILKDVPFSQWRTHPFNTGVGTYPVTLMNGTTIQWSGPLGTGPFIFDSYNPATGVVTKHRWADWWGGPGPGNITTFKMIYIPEVGPALAAVKSGDVQILDSLYDIEKQIPDIQTWGATLNHTGFRINNIQMNLWNPYFGTGTGTPLGEANASAAPEAARDVRIALSLAIPRQDIINAFYPLTGQPISTLITPAMAGYKYIQPYPFNLTEAQEYMMKAGYQYPGAATMSTTAAATSSSFDPTYIAVTVLVVLAIVGIVAVLRRKKST